MKNNCDADPFGSQYGDDRVYRDADKHLYVMVDDKTLIIDGNIIIKNYAVGETSLELSMSNIPSNGGPGSANIAGDFAPIDFDPEHRADHRDWLANEAANDCDDDLDRRAA